MLEKQAKADENNAMQNRLKGFGTSKHSKEPVEFRMEPDLLQETQKTANRDLS